MTQGFDAERKRKCVWSRLTTLMRLSEKYGKKCWYCGKKFTSFREVEIDHIVPQCRGGKHHMDNYAIACITCNKAKSDSTLEDFLAWLKRPKKPLPHIHQRSKESEQHWRDWGDEIEKGLRRPANSQAPKHSDRRVAYDVRVVPVEPVEPVEIDVTPT